MLQFDTIIIWTFFWDKLVQPFLCIIPSAWQTKKRTCNIKMY